MNKENFGLLITKLRKEKKITQKDLADMLFVSSSTVSKWEKGVSVPDIDLFSRLSDIFGISVSEMMECIKDTSEVEGLSKDTELASENNIHVNNMEDIQISEESELLIPKDINKSKRIKTIIAIVVGLIAIILGLLILLIYFSINSINLTNEPKTKIVNEFFETDADYFGYQNIYYIVIEYDGDMTTDYVQEYRDEIRINFEEYFLNADLLIVIFVDEYLGIESIDRPDYELVLYPSMIEG